jgi:LuxR family maltose regulon positive regulatory protein
VSATLTSEIEGRRREPQLIERPRLLEVLDNSDARVIALIAPAGFGKTTLARQWISSRKIGGAWYSVGPEGFDIAAVAARIAAAVSTVVSGAGARMLTRLSVSTDPEADAVLLAEMLSEDLAAWPADAQLVIDDYQVLAASRACERFVGTLVRETPLRLLITSRKRPSWASSRLRLYGELFELRRDQLEMTPEEAGEVLSPLASEEQRADLVRVCHGWPAILGLAARSPGAPFPKKALLRGLYDYFAEELYQGTSPELERFLCQIAAAPNISKNLLERLGSPAFELAGEAERSGFLHSAGENGERSLHPLLRTFLEQRLDEHPDRIELMDELAEALLADERWDDVWQIIHDRDRPDLLPRLIELSLPTLLDGSRVPALESWTAFGRECKLASPLLDLAEAEVAFVVGDVPKAYALALQSTYHFDESSSLCWRAHAIAARSAHHADRLESGVSHARKARVLAPDRSASQHCLWTEFLCSFEAENSDCSSLLEQLEECQDGNLEVMVRLVHGRIVSSYLLGCEPFDETLYERVRPLFERVHPQIRAGVVAAYSDHLCQSARYAEAEATLLDVWDIFTEFKFALALPGVYCGRAFIAIGLRRYRQAELFLDASERTMHSPRGTYPTLVRALREVVSLLRKDSAAAPSAMAVDRSASKTWRGLGLSIEALKWASRGDPEIALAYASRVNETTRNTEALTLSAFARAIVAARSESSSTTSLLRNAIELAGNRHRWNYFVWAYRAYPDLLRLAAVEPDITRAIRPVLLSAHDQQLAARNGIKLEESHERQLDPSEGLTRREREVLRLVADGLSNKEVASELFISDVTVKAHLRHIYEKLGVRNRMEAALHAVYSD